ncbi:hypothetical protein [Micromonospora fulviviridis]|uniref:Malonyl-CoA:ACP transacylase (MAT) domain-containing protein n=1 Tax=Micromonospora fulviviridis TaxID=47860 RepID=A0ABV2VU17_9ACTN
MSHIMLFDGLAGGNRSPLHVLRALARQPENIRFMRMAFEAVQAALNHVGAEVLHGILPYGLPLRQWLSSDTEPPAHELANSVVDGVATHVSQLCILAPHRVDVEPPHLQLHPSLALGYSLGLLSAVVGSMRLTDRRDFLQASRASITMTTVLMLRAQQCVPLPVRAATPTISTMALIIGIDANIIRDASTEYRRAGGAVEVAIVNSARSLVLAGSPEALGDFRAVHRELLAGHRARWSDLPCTVPFHTSALQALPAMMEADRSFLEYDFIGSHLQVPVYGGGEPTNLQSNGDLLADCLRAAVCDPIDWPHTLRTAVGTRLPDFILDYGPGDGARVFTRDCLRSMGLHPRFQKQNSCTYSA